MAETTLTVDGVVFKGWDQIQFTRKMDSFGTFNFSSVWDSSNKEFRKIYKPFEYKPVAIFDGSDLMFNGTMIEVIPQSTSETQVVSAMGYSLPAVLNDCTPPISALPLERDLNDLQQNRSSTNCTFRYRVNF